MCIWKEMRATRVCPKSWFCIFNLFPDLRRYQNQTAQISHITFIYFPDIYFIFSWSCAISNSNYSDFPRNGTSLNFPQIHSNWMYSYSTNLHIYSTFRSWALLCWEIYLISVWEASYSRIWQKIRYFETSVTDNSAYWHRGANISLDGNLIAILIVPNQQPSTRQDQHCLHKTMI